MSAAALSPASPASAGLDPAALGLRTGLRRPAFLGAVAAVTLFAALLGWAMVTPIAGAVVASGQAMVRGKPKLVQSLDGGIVAEIAVANGDRVRAGELLMRLDPTVLQVNLDIARRRLAEEMARRARLEAERAGLAAPVFAYDPMPFALPDTTAPEAGQARIFAARAELQQGRAARTAEKIDQIESQVAGTLGQLEARRETLGYLQASLDNVASLSAQGLARQSQTLELQRARTATLGEIAGLEAERARLETAIRDARIEALQADREFTEGVVTELGEAAARIDELVLEILTTGTQLDRVEIRAPAAGIVHEMQTTTVDGVVAPGATILQVIPLDQGLEFELRLEPRDVDRVHPGQAAQVTMAALDPRTTPKLEGRVARVAPGTVTDPVTGHAFYRVVLEVPAAELARLGDADLVPGMPVEAFLETGERTVMSYLLKPLTAQFDRAFRED